MDDEGWRRLFDRAAAAGVTEADVRAALGELRGDRGADETDEADGTDGGTGGAVDP